MDFVIASTKALPPGKILGVVKNNTEMLVANVEGKYYAIGNVCTHNGCKLSDGVLKGDKLMCICHGSTFDVRTGAVVMGPAKKPEPSYQLKIDGDQILANLQVNSI
jgi:nitrite reductase/ring-hydroxylating ferredoxin subunit